MVKLIFGLGNPGRNYNGTRHNLGFEVIDQLAAKYKVPVAPGPGDFLWGTWVRANGDVVLAKPTTFMNACGEALVQMKEFFDYTPDEVLVICDDIDLPLGKLRLRPDGSDGGHKGLQSVIYHLQSEDFPRLRLGIGRPVTAAAPAPEKKEQVAEYVLDRFLPEEQKVKEEIVNRAVVAVEICLESGLQTAMNQFN